MNTSALLKATRDWLAQPSVVAVMDALRSAGGSPRFVGGCVRDALLGRPGADIDVAVDLEPLEVVDALDRAAIRAVPTGIDHGTVTGVVGGRAVEVTSLRRDVETDGRRAVVSFTKDWREDSLRRDFTINALYVDPEGVITDFHGGLDDLSQRRLRFIGDPSERIREDVLRILRFFRFLAQLDIKIPDPEALAACRHGVPLLPSLSAERVAAEVLRLLSQEAPAPVLAIMRDIGALSHWLPEAMDESALTQLIDLERSRGNGDPIRRLAALCPAGGGTVGARFKLSSADQDRLRALDQVGRAAPDNPRRALYALGADRAVDASMIGLARGEGAWQSLLSMTETWTTPVFPIKGADVLALGVAPGPAVGDILRDLEQAWIAADFDWDRAGLLSRLKTRVEGGAE